MQPKFINKMNLINLQEDFKSKMQDYGSGVISAVFERISCMLSLSHAKKLLLTHGTESFSDYIHNYFDVTKKDKKNIRFIKNLKETPDYEELMSYIEETKTTKNHPKLKKLSEILDNFF